MLHRRAELSLLAYDVSWEQAGVGPKHSALSTPSPGVTVEERQELVPKAMDELAAAGLVHRGRIDGDLLDTWTVLACARREFYGWFTPDGVAEHAVVVAAAGEDAVIGVTDGAALALTPIRPTALAVACAGTARGRAGERPFDQHSAQRNRRNSARCG